MKGGNSKEISDFLYDHRRKFKASDAERTLAESGIVRELHAFLVPDLVSEDDFWQRYCFRCNKVRIMKQLEIEDPKTVRDRAKSLGMNKSGHQKIRPSSAKEAVAAVKIADSKPTLASEVSFKTFQLRSASADKKMSIRKLTKETQEPSYRNVKLRAASHHESTSLSSSKSSNKTEPSYKNIELKSTLEHKSTSRKKLAKREPSFKNARLKATSEHKSTSRKIPEKKEPSYKNMKLKATSDHVRTDRALAFSKEPLYRSIKLKKTKDASTTNVSISQQSSSASKEKCLPSFESSKEAIRSGTLPTEKQLAARKPKVQEADGEHPTAAMSKQSEVLPNPAEDLVSKTSDSDSLGPKAAATGTMEAAPHQDFAVSEKYIETSAVTVAPVQGDLSNDAPLTSSLTKQDLVEEQIFVDEYKRKLELEKQNLDAEERLLRERRLALDALKLRLEEEERATEELRLALDAKRESIAAEKRTLEEQEARSFFSGFMGNPDANTPKGVDRLRMELAYAEEGFVAANSGAPVDLKIETTRGAIVAENSTKDEDDMQSGSTVVEAKEPISSATNAGQETGESAVEKVSIEVAQVQGQATVAGSEPEVDSEKADSGKEKVDVEANPKQEPPVQAQEVHTISQLASRERSVAHEEGSLPVSESSEIKRDGETVTNGAENSGCFHVTDEANSHDSDSNHQDPQKDNPSSQTESTTAEEAQEVPPAPKETPKETPKSSNGKKKKKKSITKRSSHDHTSESATGSKKIKKKSKSPKKNSSERKAEFTQDTTSASVPSSSVDVEVAETLETSSPDSQSNDGSSEQGKESQMEVSPASNTQDSKEEDLGIKGQDPSEVHVQEACVTCHEPNELASEVAFEESSETEKETSVKTRSETLAPKARVGQDSTRDSERASNDLATATAEEESGDDQVAVTEAPTDCGIAETKAESKEAPGKEVIIANGEVSNEEDPDSVPESGVSGAMANDEGNSETTVSKMAAKEASSTDSTSVVVAEAMAKDEASTPANPTCDKDIEGSRLEQLTADSRNISPVASIAEAAAGEESRTQDGINSESKATNGSYEEAPGPSPDATVNQNTVPIRLWNHSEPRENGDSNDKKVETDEQSEEPEQSQQESFFSLGGGLQFSWNYLQKPDEKDQGVLEGNTAGVSVNDKQGGEEQSMTSQNGDDIALTTETDTAPSPMLSTPKPVKDVKNEAALAAVSETLLSSPAKSLAGFLGLSSDGSSGASPEQERAEKWVTKIVEAEESKVDSSHHSFDSQDSLILQAMQDDQTRNESTEPTKSMPSTVEHEVLSTDLPPHDARPSSKRNILTEEENGTDPDEENGSSPSACAHCRRKISVLESAQEASKKTAAKDES
ncbi:MAG: hypothetical protein SGILL_002190 [Bacillariaceae sp.]